PRAERGGGAAVRRRGDVRATGARCALRRPAPSLRDRDAEGHRRPLPHLALHLHAPAVRLDDAARDGEAEAGAGAAGAARLPERVEEARALLLGDARPGVRDAEDDVAAVARRAHGDAAALGRELDRVVDQVGEDLEDAVVVDGDGWQ